VPWAAAEAAGDAEAFVTIIVLGFFSLLFVFKVSYSAKLISNILYTLQLLLDPFMHETHTGRHLKHSRRAPYVVQDMYT